jgi:hypothetical protein
MMFLIIGAMSKFWRFIDENQDMESVAGASTPQSRVHRQGLDKLDLPTQPGGSM